MPKKRKKRAPVHSVPQSEPKPQPETPRPSAKPVTAVGVSYVVHGLISVGLVVATCLLYGGATELGFFSLDDPTYIVQNPRVQGFTADNLWFVLTEPYFANYSPVHLLSYLFDHALGGLDPRVFHISNHVWAGLVACGVYALACLLFDRWWVALLAALAFVAHPAHVEAVAWISSRKDLVASAFALPAIAFYVLYRRGGARAKWAYAASLVLFLLAVAGKLSVVVVPGILFALDWLADKRRDAGAVLDKIPYALVAMPFVLRVLGAQPSTNQPFDLFVVGHSTLKSLWLLTGFGEHVLVRPRPVPGDYGPTLRWCLTLVPFVLATAPLLLVRKVPGVVVALAYFVLFALVPSQVIGFIHPVADRYLFFPSVGVVLLLAWGGAALVRRFESAGAGVAAVCGLVIGLCWAQATLAYLSEWRDPRSVWFAASTKSGDITVFQYLGSHYQDAVDELPKLGKDPAVNARATRLAKALWGEDPRLPPLLEEWDSGRAGPRTDAYKKHLLGLAQKEYENAVATGSKRIVPNLYFRIGKLAADRGDYERAKVEFRRALQISQTHTSRDVREQLAVMCQNALGLVYWRENNYEEALRWVSEAEATQKKYGGQWLPQVTEYRQRLERLVGRSQ